MVVEVHLYTVGVLVEHVQAQRSHESVAQGVLLIEVASDSAGLLVPPSTPLIDEQADGVLRILLVHDGLVFFDDLLYLQALA